MIGYDQLWLNVIGSCDKSRLLFSCELSTWVKKIMALLTIYKVSKLTRLNITAMCHIKIKLEMAWKRDDCQSVSIQRDEMKYLRVCDSVYRAFMTMTRISWLLKIISEHQFTIKKLRNVYYTKCK